MNGSEEMKIEVKNETVEKSKIIKKGINSTEYLYPFLKFKMIPNSITKRKYGWASLGSRINPISGKRVKKKGCFKNKKTRF